MTVACRCPRQSGLTALHTHARCTGPACGKRASCAVGGFPFSVAHSYLVPYASRATEKCKRRFDAPGRSCTRCEEHLPAAFFHQGQTICISCTRAYSALRVSLMVVPVPPAQQQCVRCQRTLPAARFHAHISASSGLCAHCKDCLRELNRESQQSIRKVPLPATMQTSVRRCTACQQVKPRSAFRKDATRANGLTYKCKACTGEYERMSRSRQPGADSPAQQLS